jgi:hypothetical protein
MAIGPTGRRGVLKMLGLGAVAGPSVAKEALAPAYLRKAKAAQSMLYQSADVVGRTSAPEPDAVVQELPAFMRQGWDYRKVWRMAYKAGLVSRDELLVAVRGQRWHTDPDYELNSYKSFSLVAKQRISAERQNQRRIERFLADGELEDQGKKPGDLTQRTTELFEKWLFSTKSKG